MEIDMNIKPSKYECWAHYDELAYSNCDPRRIESAASNYLCAAVAWKMQGNAKKANECMHKALTIYADPKRFYAAAVQLEEAADALETKLTNAESAIVLRKRAIKQYIDRGWNDSADLEGVDGKYYFQKARLLLDRLPEKDRAELENELKDDFAKIEKNFRKDQLPGYSDWV